MATSQSYSFEGLENLWTQNGGNPEWAPTMAAVAMAESQGNPAAANASGATGVWQILSSAQSAAFNAQHPAASMTDPNANARAAIALLGNGGGISNWTADPVGAAIVANGSKPLTPQQAQQYATQGVSTNATLDADVSTQTDLPPGSTVIPKTTFAAPLKDVNPKNFMGSGIDLSAIPANELGNAEAAVKRYITDPGYAKQLQDRISQDYGYQDSWAQKIPELNGVLLWAASNLDLSTAAGKNQFQSAVSNTTWWKTTDANKRSWQQVQSSDPAQAHQALQDAQDKVLATANQIGVKLTKQQLSQIAGTYAEQTFVQSGALGSQSGTSQEWLDQAVVDTVLNVKNSGSVTGTGSAVSQDFAAGTTDITASTDPSQLTGVAGQLYQKLQGIAQSYLLYDPSNPNSGLLTQQDLMKQVGTYLQNYTGSGSFGSSNLISGAVSAFTQQAMAQAKSVYPSLATAIDSGSAPADYVAPLTNYVASQVGMSSGQINVMDPQWNWLVASSDPTTGVKGPVTQDQAMQKITAVGSNGKNTFSWTDPNGQQQTWDNTNTAVQNATAMTNSLSSMFGVGGQ